MDHLSDGNSSIAARLAQAQDAQMIQDMFEGFDDNELQEIQEAQKDIYGSIATTTSKMPPPQHHQPQQHDDSSSSAVTDPAVQGLKDALEQLSPSQKEAYEEAMRLNPRVVELETPLKRWVKTHGLNFWKASCALAGYWQRRKAIYGADKFYLPLTLAGGENENVSALSPVAIQALLSGAWVILPPDGLGRVVCLVDREKIQVQWKNNEVRMQIYFYYAHVVCEDDMAIENGWVALYCMEKTVKGIEGGAFGNVVGLIRSDFFPAMPKAVHLLAMKQPSILEKAAKDIIPRCESWKQLGLRVVPHYGTSREEFIDDLKEYAFSEIHVPERFGGAHTSEGSGWYLKRLRLEAKRYNLQSLKHPLNPTDACLQYPRSQASRVDAGDRKRKMEEVRFLAEEYDEKKKIAKLQLEQQEMKKQNGLLEAYVTCVKFMGKRFEDDYKKIHTYLKGALPTLVPFMTCRPPNPDLSSEATNDSMAHVFLTEYFVFEGSDPVSGLWIFTASDKILLMRGAVRVLMKLENDLRSLQRGNFGREGDAAETRVIRERGNEEGDKAVGGMLDSLQSQVEKLREQKSALEGYHKFLKALTTCATSLGEENEQDRTSIRKDIQKALDHLNVTNTIQEATLDEFLDNVLNHQTVYRGRNPITGEKMYQFKPGVFQQLEQLSGGKVEVAAAMMSIQGHVRRKTEVETERVWRKARAKRKSQLKRL